MTAVPDAARGRSMCMGVCRLCTTINQHKDGTPQSFNHQPRGSHAALHIPEHEAGVPGASR